MAGRRSAPDGVQPKPSPRSPSVLVDAEEDAAVTPALRQITGYLLRRAHGVFQAYWIAKFREAALPITPVQGGMLLVIAQNEGLTQTALAKIMNVEGPTLLQSIDRLEQHGYVQRARRPGDRRSYTLLITALGKKVLGDVMNFVPIRDDEIMSDLSADERRQLNELLSRIIIRGQAKLRAVAAAPAATLEGAAPAE